MTHCNSRHPTPSDCTTRAKLREQYWKPQLLIGKTPCQGEPRFIANLARLDKTYADNRWLRIVPNSLHLQSYRTTSPMNPISSLGMLARPTMQMRADNSIEDWSYLHRRQCAYGATIWSTRKQIMTAISSKQAEYIAISEAHARHVS